MEVAFLSFITFDGAMLKSIIAEVTKTVLKQSDTMPIRGGADQPKSTPSSREQHAEHFIVLTVLHFSSPNGDLMRNREAVESPPLI